MYSFAKEVQMDNRYKICLLSLVIRNSNQRSQIDGSVGREGGQENSVFILTDWQKSQGLVGLLLVGW